MENGNYRYRVSDLELIIPGKNNINLGQERVAEMQLLNDYDNYFFPIFRVVLSLSYEQYYQIIENKERVKFYIRIKYFKFEGDDVDVFEKDIMNGVFCTFIDDTTPSLNQDIVKRSRETGENSLNSFQSSIELFLFKEEELNSSKNINNYVISDTTVTTAISYCLMKSGMRNVLLSPVDNTEKYDNIIIPVGNIMQNIEFIDKNYGIFNTWSTLFFDYDTTYLIDRKPKCTASRNLEKTKVNINVSTDDNYDNFIGKMIETDTGYTFNVTRGSINFNNYSMTNEHIKGNDIIIVDADGYKMDDSGVTQRGGKNYRVVVNKGGNKLLSSCEKNSVKENSLICSLNINDFDMNAFKPNKELILGFNDISLNKNMAGHYRISKSEMFFKKSGEHFLINGTLLLKRNEEIGK